MATPYFLAVDLFFTCDPERSERFLFAKFEGSAFDFV
jgi:hypothetical protein